MSSFLICLSTHTLFFSLFSGGTLITVRGDGLDLVQKPEFVTTYGGKFFREVLSSLVSEITLLICFVLS